MTYKPTVRSWSADLGGKLAAVETMWVPGVCKHHDRLCAPNASAVLPKHTQVLHSLGELLCRVDVGPVEGQVLDKWNVHITE